MPPVDDAPSRSLARAPFGALSIADDGIVVFANEQLHRWLDAPPGSLQGRSIDHLLTNAARVFYNTHLFPLLKLHGHADEIYLTLRSERGAELPMLVSGVRDTDTAPPMNHCALVPMRRRREFESALVEARRAAEAATRAKDEFLAMVSHELRTPLGAILGWTRLAQSGRLDATTMARALETIARNAQLQSQLIEDLLDVSRIVSGKLRLSLRPVDVTPAFEAALDTARPTAHAKEIVLTHEVELGAGIVNADPDRVQQIVWNLLSNAVKFTPKGGRVHASLGPVDSSVRIRVTDTGPGVPPNQLPYLFDRFWQATTGGRRERTGLGLGLAICRHLVELHGGTIQVASEPGQGATFTVDLPLAPVSRAPAPSEAAALEPRSDAAYGAALSGVKVLVVDDDADTRSLLHSLLTIAGAQVHTAVSAAEAMDHLQTMSLHVLVSDVGMPGKDGVALIRELREAGIATSQIPAIALTGQTRAQDRIELLHAGFQSHVSKPVDPRELVALVAALARHAPP